MTRHRTGPEPTGRRRPGIAAKLGAEFAAPDPEQVRRQLSALHGGVERAQAEQSRR